MSAARHENSNGIIMENLESKTPIVNDLIQLNVDRIAGYEKAIQVLDENAVDLNTYGEKTEELSSDTRFILAQQKQQLRLAYRKLETLYTEVEACNR